MLCVPNTTSTQGALVVISARSFCARQPPTAICIPGWAFLTGSSWPRLPYRRFLALSRTPPGVETTTSRAAPPAPPPHPPPSTRPPRRPASRTFFSPPPSPHSHLPPPAPP